MYYIIYSYTKWLFLISAASLQSHCNMASDNRSRKHGAASAPSMLRSNHQISNIAVLACNSPAVLAMT